MKCVDIKKLGCFFCFIIFLSGFFYSIKTSFVSRAAKKFSIQKKLKASTYNAFLKRYYTTKFKSISPLRLLREKLRNWLSNYTYEFVELSKAYKLPVKKQNFSSKLLLQPVEKEEIIVSVAQALQDFYKNNFLSLVTHTSIFTVERIGNMVNVFVDGKYITQKISVKNKAFLDYIFIHTIDATLIENSVFRITYDLTLGQDFEASVKVYKFTEDIKKIFDNNVISEKKSLRILTRFFADIASDVLDTKKQVHYNIKFTNLLKKLISNEYAYVDQRAALKIIISSYISLLKTIHVQIIPKASEEILVKDCEKAEKKIKEQLKKIITILEEINKSF